MKKIIITIWFFILSKVLYGFYMFYGEVNTGKKMSPLAEGNALKILHRRYAEYGKDKYSAVADAYGMKTDDRNLLITPEKLKGVRGENVLDLREVKLTRYVMSYGKTYAVAAMKLNDLCYYYVLYKIKG